MKRFISIQFIFLLLAFGQGASLQAQNNPEIKRTMHWYFGFGAGLDFSKGYPEVDTTGKSAGPEECFTMSDTCGNLLFYGAEDSTNSKLVIWTKNHTIMQDGILNSCCNPTQCVCVPQPGNDSLFYVFYNHLGGSLLGKLYYAIININQNNGLGKVISSNDILIDSLGTEKVAATIHCNGIDYWIASKDKGNDFLSESKIRTWLLTSTGINTTPVLSLSEYAYENGDGYFRFSSDASMAALSYVYPASLYKKDSSYVVIYKFDNCTGIYSDPIKIQFPQPYGLCFSPDNSKLYVGVADGIMTGEVDTAFIKQYDLSNYNQSSVLASSVILKQGAISNHFQIGLDGKIYVVGYDTTLQNCGSDRLGVIQNPNLSGFACNYNAEQIDLLIIPPIGYLYIGLPYWPDSYFSSFNYTTCGPYVISTNHASFNINIYPNPCNEFINIESELLKNCQISINDILGNTIFYKKAGETVETINTKQLLSGIYFIQINNSYNQFINLKFLKQ